MKFDKESVGSNSSSTTPSNSLHAHATDSPTITTVAVMDFPRQKTDTCFRCHQIGHWAKDCPNKTPNGSHRPSPSKSPADHGVPVLLCLCGGPCFVKVSGTPRNPNRKFYTCPSQGTRCKFFKWCDEVKREDMIDQPICKCEAGPCRIDGKFFICPIKRGHGACNFKIPMDAHINQATDTSCSTMPTLTDCHEIVEDPVLPDGDDFALSDDVLENLPIDFDDGNLSSPQSTVTNSGNTSPSNSDVIEEGDITLPRTDIDRGQVVTPVHSQCRFISDLPRKHVLPLVNFEGDQETSDVPLRRHCKRMRHGAPKVNGIILDSSTERQQRPFTLVESLAAEQTFCGAPNVSGLASEDSIHLRQAEFLRQIACAEDSSLGVADSFTLSPSEDTHLPIKSVPLSHNYLEATTIFQTVGFQGWCGRVVHLPSQGLQFAQPKPFFCGVFPNFDPIEVPQLTSNELKESAVGPPLKVSPGSRIAQQVSRFQKQFAMQIQNELISSLESTDFHEHEFMADEAAIIYNALEGCSVQYQPFKEIVDAFINKAKSLAQGEESVYSDRTSFELVEKQKYKKQRLDDVSRRHSKTLVDLDASNEQLRELEKEATRLRELLAHAEEILGCCKAENEVIRTRFDLISKDKSEAEVSFEVASIEAEEAVKIRQLKEAELDAAKADFDKARSNLRQSCQLTCLT